MGSIRWFGFYRLLTVAGHKEVGLTCGWCPRVGRGSVNLFLWNWCLVIGPHVGLKATENNATVKESIDADSNEKGR